MPQNLQQKTVSTFNKGLITEFSELQFPEGASIDELNCNLSRDGSRSRRLGLEYETDFVLSSFTQDEDEIFNVGEWRNAGGINDFTLVVVQHGSVLSFYAKNNAPFSAQEQTFTVNLSTYETATGDSSVTPCQFASLAGLLVVVSEAINPIYVSYNSGSNSVSVTQISFRVRDFDWQSDLAQLSNFVANASVTAARQYDTKNSGWDGTYGSAALSTYAASRIGYPPLTHPWFSGKDSGDNFSLVSWEKVYTGSSILGNGRYILDFFNKDRSAASGIVGLTPEVESNRFKAVATYAGRVWYAGLGSGKNTGRILYSRIVETLNDSGINTVIGECFQSNDPTSEYTSDPLETDGGVITIPDSANIRILFNFGPFLYVFAENGVWVIGGADDKFSPTSYFVSRISQVGILNENTFVSADGIPFWWSNQGIHTFSFDDQQGVSRLPRESNISISTIQTFWDEIDNNAKSKCVATYDQVNKKIFWVYPENGETKLNKRTRALILDIPLQAFYPWKITATSSYPMAFSFYDAYGSALDYVDVVDNSGVPVTISGPENVQILESQVLTNNDVRIIVWSRDSSTGFITVSLFTNKAFRDFGNLDYESYAEAGYDFVGDLTLKKTAPYITVYCRSTEEGFVGNETIGYDAINQSSLIMKAYWDFKEEPSSSQQAYRVKPYAMVNTMDLANNQQNRSVVTTRLKVRGRGRSMRLRFESETGKNFVLLGYGVVVGANSSF